jgi:hypothetical protein
MKEDSAEFKLAKELMNIATEIEAKRESIEIANTAIAQKRNDESMWMFHSITALKMNIKSLQKEIETLKTVFKIKLSHELSKTN